MNRMKVCFRFFVILCMYLISYLPSFAQLKVGTSSSEINFRQGPGANFKVLQKIDSSNLLVILPKSAENGFVEAFDVETSSRGYVYENLIRITDTLNYSQQHFFEKSGDTTSGEIEISIINKTNQTLFVWINDMTYDIYPREKKVLILEDEDILYFSSAPGLFPVFGKEILQKGSAYIWKFSL